MTTKTIDNYIKDKQVSLRERGLSAFPIVNNDFKNILNILNAEYGQLLDIILRCKRVYVNEIDVPSLKYNTVYMQSVLHHQNFYEGKDFEISGIAIYHRQRKKFQLIDGYHRTALNMKNDVKKAQYIILE